MFEDLVRAMHDLVLDFFELIKDRGRFTNRNCVCHFFHSVRSDCQENSFLKSVSPSVLNPSRRLKSKLVAARAINARPATPNRARPALGIFAAPTSIEAPTDPTVS